MLTHPESQVSTRPNSGPDEPFGSQGQQNSQPNQSSQAPAIPNFPREPTRSSINSLLNDAIVPSRALVPTQNGLVVDRAYTVEVLSKLVQQTSGMNLEQMEQIYSTVMNEIWRTRGEWDRTEVARTVMAAIDEVAEDIHDMQEVATWSMEA